jgi:Tfp pilus assembly protein PilN
MKDYNFFSEYQNKRGISIDARSPMFIGAMILVLMVAACVGLVVRNVMLTNETEKLYAEIEAIHTSEDYINANKLQESIDAMAQYDKNAEVALTKFRDSSVIGTALMTTLSTKLPTTSVMMTMTIDNLTANFTFSVPNRKAAAELLLSLKDTGLFQNVLLNSITTVTDTGRSEVSISAVMKAGEAK